MELLVHHEHASRMDQGGAHQPCSRRCRWRATRNCRTCRPFSKSRKPTSSGRFCKLIFTQSLIGRVMFAPPKTSQKSTRDSSQGVRRGARGQGVSRRRRKGAARDQRAAGRRASGGDRDDLYRASPQRIQEAAELAGRRLMQAGLDAKGGAQSRVALAMTYFSTRRTGVSGETSERPALERVFAIARPFALHGRLRERLPALVPVPQMNAMPGRLRTQRGQAELLPDALGLFHVLAWRAAPAAA